MRRKYYPFYPRVTRCMKKLRMMENCYTIHSNWLKFYASLIWPFYSRTSLTFSSPTSWVDFSNCLLYNSLPIYCCLVQALLSSVGSRLISKKICTQIHCCQIVSQTRESWPISLEILSLSFHTYSLWTSYVWSSEFQTCSNSVTGSDHW